MRKLILALILAAVAFYAFVGRTSHRHTPASCAGCDQGVAPSVAIPPPPSLAAAPITPPLVPVVVAPKAPTSTKHKAKRKRRVARPVVVDRHDLDKLFMW